MAKASAVVINAGAKASDGTDLSSFETFEAVDESGLAAVKAALRGDAAPRAPPQEILEAFRNQAPATPPALSRVAYVDLRS